MAVEVLALQRDEQRGAVDRQRAGIGGDDVDQPVLAMQAATGHVGDVGKRQ